MNREESELREALSRCVEIAVAYWESSRGPSQLPPANALSDPHLAEAGIGIDGALTQLRREVLPYLNHTVGPRFFGFVTGGITPASLAGDWIASAIDQLPNPYDQCISTQVTDQAIQYLLDLFGLPREQFDGGFTSGSSVANLIALTTARQWFSERVGIDVTEQGIGSLGEVAVYAAAPHMSIPKALGIIGLGRQAMQCVPSLPDREAIDPAALDRMLTASAAPHKIVVASAGTVSTGDFDDLVAVAAVCARHKAWLHVDGAFGLFARCCAGKQALLDGLELADSIAVDMHKWLNVPYDCGLLLSRHVRCLESAHRTSGTYFFDTHSDIPDYSDRGIQLSMRFRALPVWMTLKSYGRSGIASMIERNCTFAERLGQWLQESGKYELLAPVRLNILLFRSISPVENTKEQNSLLIETINRTRLLYCSPGRFLTHHGIRMAICNWRTDLAELDLVTQILERAHAEIAP